MYVTASDMIASRYQGTCLCSDIDDVRVVHIGQLRRNCVTIVSSVYDCATRRAVARGAKAAQAALLAQACPLVSPIGA